MAGSLSITNSILSRAGALRRRAQVLLRATIETVVLLLVCLAPWPYGSVDARFELVLFAGVGLLLVLWGARMLLEGRLCWKKCPVALCLALLFLWGIWQITPLPRHFVATLSPGAGQFYSSLLPVIPEVLAFDEPRAMAATAPGSTLSLYTYATSRELTRLLAVFFLFAVVRNNLDPGRGLRRLAIVAVVNGSLLSLFGIVQFMTAAPNMVYWTSATKGSVFGPFICKNHFAFYINLCIGLGAGLIVSLLWPKHALRDRLSSNRWRERPRFESAIDVLHRPAMIWVGGAVALMASAVACSLSRGGILALTGAALACAVTGWATSRRARALKSAAVIGAAALALAAWFGLGRLETRLATLWQGDVLRDDRLTVLSNAMPLIREFPIWGTGYGTFNYVEPHYRTSSADAGYRYEHAHNDYLEAQIEGGIVRLALSLLAIFWIYRLGWRAYRRGAANWQRGLALGGIFAFTTLVIHSLVDFGIHIPAITVLATVLCAYLCGLATGKVSAVRVTSHANPPPQGGSERAGNLPPQGKKETAGNPLLQGTRDANEDEYSLHLGGVAPVLGAIGGVVIALVLYAEGVAAQASQALRHASAQLERTEGAAASIAPLEAATRLASKNALLHLQLADTYFNGFSDVVEQLRTIGRAADVADAVLQTGSAPNPGLATALWGRGIVGYVAAVSAREQYIASQTRQAARELQVPGLRHALLARDLCPVAPEPQLRIALNLEGLRSSDAREVYLERAQFLDPVDPEIWYQSGLAESRDWAWERTWRDWRRSLTLSDRFLEPILERSSIRLGPRELVDFVLPQSPRMLAAAAVLLYPQMRPAAERREFLEAALGTIANPREAFSSEDAHARARMLASLGRSAEAAAAYQEALTLDPSQPGWRYEYAVVLHQQGRLQDARSELRAVLDQQPDNSRAREKLDRVNLDIARK
jgi:O-antigen ligase/tetratricopeptide (TPR) repeat protein